MRRETAIPQSSHYQNYPLHSCSDEVQRLNYSFDLESEVTLFHPEFLFDFLLSLDTASHFTLLISKLSSLFPTTVHTFVVAVFLTDFRTIGPQFYLGTDEG